MPRSAWAVEPREETGDGTESSAMLDRGSGPPGSRRYVIEGNTCLLRLYIARLIYHACFRTRYQELQPQYMKEAQRVWEKHERPLELLTILEQNFVKDSNETWRVPDPRKEADLEQIRNRALLKEFQQYLVCVAKVIDVKFTIPDQVC